MNLLFVVAHGESGAYLRGLSAACRRNRVAFSVFFTGDGVRTLSAPDTVEHARYASEAVVCEHSLQRTPTGCWRMHSVHIERPQREHDSPVSRSGCQWHVAGAVLTRSPCSDG